MTTNIYLDVDGVLNALPYDVEHFDTWPSTSWRSEIINGYVITWSTDLVYEINLLAAREDVTFKWLTTWCELAQQHIAPGLGLNGAHLWELTNNTRSDDSHFGSWRPAERTWWKLAALQGDVETFGEPEKMVWIDDDHGYYGSHYESWTASKVESGQLLVVQPRTNLGITPDDLERIKEFIDG